MKVKETSGEPTPPGNKSRETSEGVQRAGHRQPDTASQTGRHMRVRETSGEPDTTGKPIYRDK
jgi:hypothetical protein